MNTILQVTDFIEKIVLWGIANTLFITVGSFLVSGGIGLMLAVASVGRNPWMRRAVDGYVELLRGVPVLTQLFIVYFGLPLIGIRLPPVVAAICGFGLSGGAFLCEVIRPAIAAIDRGQTEAALALGILPRQALWIVVMPQVFRLVLPSLGNSFISLLKDSSIASAFAAPEMTFQAKALAEGTSRAYEAYLSLALIYLALSLPISLFMSRIQARSSRGHG